MDPGEAGRLDQYCEYIREQLPSLVRRDLQTTIESQVLETLCGRLPALLEALNQELYQSFQSTNVGLAAHTTPSSQDSPTEYSVHTRTSDGDNPADCSEQAPRHLDPRLVTVDEHLQPPIFLGDFTIPIESLGTDSWTSFDFSVPPVQLEEEHVAQEKGSACGYGSFEWACPG